MILKLIHIEAILFKLATKIELCIIIWNIQVHCINHCIDYENVALYPQV